MSLPLRRVMFAGIIPCFFACLALTQPPLQTMLTVALTPLFFWFHIRVALYRCPTCGEQFARSKSALKTSTQGLARAYFSSTCGMCGARYDDEPKRSPKS